MFNFNLNDLLFRIVAFVIAFSIHEWAHAMVAYRLGDNTAKQMGRLTLNPISHIEPFGLIMILFGPFGWARPVPFDPHQIRGNKRLGIVLISIAGPLSNLLLAFISLKALVWVDQSLFVQSWSPKTVELVMGILKFSFLINVAMFVFNLLPIPPLDGSKILRYILPAKTDRHFEKYEPYGTFVLLMLIIIPGVSSLILLPPYEWVTNTLFSIVS